MKRINYRKRCKQLSLENAQLKKEKEAYIEELDHAATEIDFMFRQFVKLKKFISNSIQIPRRYEY